MLKARPSGERMPKYPKASTAWQPGKRYTSLGNEEPNDESMSEQPSDTAETPSEHRASLSNPFDVSLAAFDASDKDLGTLKGYNLTSGIVGWNSNPLPVTVLLDTGSDLSYISRKAFDRLQGDVKISKARPVRVRLTDGNTTLSTQLLTTGVTLGAFRARSNLRILDWDAYDVILGMDWLQLHNATWDFAGSKMSVRNGSGQTSLISLRPFRTIDYGGIEEAGLNLMSFKAASKYIRKANHRKSRPKESPEESDSKHSTLLRSYSQDRKPFLMVIRDKTNPGEQKLMPPLPPTTSIRLRHLLHRYKRVFKYELPSQKPQIRTIKHEIDTGDAKPINLPYYPLSKTHRDEQDRQIRELLEKDLIRPSASPWGFPVLFVPKPGGEWRMCIDYRLLNNVTTKDAYPLPRIQDCLDTIGSAKVLSKIDLLSGYYQIEMGELSIPKTAFNTRSGKYEFMAMPFGLTNAPSTFQRIMNDALREFNGKFLVVYLDDIVIYSNSEEEHEKHLQQVLEALDGNELYAKPSKCTIGVQELEFCGHIIGNGKCKPTPTKVKAITEWPQPRNVHEVRQFLGLASYYRRYVRDFAKTAAPLSDLLIEADIGLRKKKFRPIRWNAKSEFAFQTLKNALATEPVLKQVDETKPFRVETDCSEWALGCVLLQTGDDGKWHPVAYDGRKLNGAELNYPIHEKELLAIKHALRIWTAYVQNGHKTEVITDHESLKYLNTTRTPSKRLARWIDEFSEFDLDIKYRKGSEAVVPDAISRRPDFLGEGPANKAWVPKQDTLQVDLSAMEATEMIDEDHTWESTIVKALSRRPGEPLSAEQVQLLRTIPDIDQYIAENQRLYRKVDKYYVPYISPPFRKDFVEYYHRHYGHYSTPALNGVIKYRGWWPKMHLEVAQFAKTCRQCQLAQRQKHRNEEPHTQVRIATRPFEKWAIDFVGPLPTASHQLQKWILTAIDFATGWPVAKAVEEATDEVVADFLFEIYCQYGAFQELLSDNGANLTSKIVEYYLRKIKVKHRTTSPYHPQTNGKVERFNGMLGKILTKMMIGQVTVGWPDYLQSALFACRVRAHTVTGMSPFKLVYGIEPRLTGDQEDFDMKNLDADFAERMETLHTARHEANRLLLERGLYAKRLRASKLTERDVGFKEQEWVIVQNEARQKFEATHFGPFKVLKKLPLGTYILETNDGRVFKQPIHGSRMAPYSLKDTTETIPDVLTSAIQSQLRRGNENIQQPTDEAIQEVLEKEYIPPSINELSLIPKREWLLLDERRGHRSVQIGEGFGPHETIANRQRRARRKKKTNQNAIQDIIPSGLNTTQPGAAQSSQSALQSLDLREQDAPRITENIELRKKAPFEAMQSVFRIQPTSKQAQTPPTVVDVSQERGPRATHHQTMEPHPYIRREMHSEHPAITTELSHANHPPRPHFVAAQARLGPTPNQPASAYPVYFDGLPEQSEAPRASTEVAPVSWVPNPLTQDSVQSNLHDLEDTITVIRNATNDTDMHKTITRLSSEPAMVTGQFNDSQMDETISRSSPEEIPDEEMELDNTEDSQLDPSEVKQREARKGLYGSNRVSKRKRFKINAQVPTQLSNALARESELPVSTPRTRYVEGRSLRQNPKPKMIRD
jgi:transposase InsO family protein